MYNIDMVDKKVSTNNLSTESSLYDFSGYNSARDYIQSVFGGVARNYWGAYGYPQYMDYQHYTSLYERMPLAKRAIDIYTTHTWNALPKLKADGVAIQEWEIFARRTGLLQTLTRLDTLALLGRYSVLLLGYFNSKYSETPRGQIVSLTPLSEERIRFDIDNTNKIVKYKMKQASRSGKVLKRKTVDVHTEKVVNVAYNTRDNRYIGTPHLAPVVNTLYDILKVSGASAEAAYLASRAMMTIKVNSSDDEGVTSAEELKAATEAVRKQVDGNSRAIGLAPQLELTSSQQREIQGSIMDTLMKQLAAGVGVPYRVLLGTEEAKLAGEQDSIHFRESIEARRTNIIEPLILRPLIKKLMESNTIPNRDNYEIDWGGAYEKSMQRYKEVYALLQQGANVRKTLAEETQIYMGTSTEPSTKERTAMETLRDLLI